MQNHLLWSKKNNPDFQKNRMYLQPAQWNALATSSRPLSRKNLQAIRFTMAHQGIPDTIRGMIWVKVFDIDSAKIEHSNILYSKLCEFPNDKACFDIKKDVDRTMSQLELWEEDLSCGNNKLFNVLKAYANYDNEIGYV